MSPRHVLVVVLVMLLSGMALPAAAQPVVGGQAPGFSLMALDGSTVTLEGLLGSTVVLHFGAGW